MGFPFLAPIKPWVVDVLTERENNKQMVVYKNPWITLTSAALVGKGKTEMAESDRLKEIKKLIESTSKQQGAYYGCIIANNAITPALSYSTQETILGIDFYGSQIKVDGEKGRKISTPIITSMDLDTDGANNTLKNAKLNIKCFSLKQLEMFELFFMKPGMNLLVEWGDSSLLKKDITPNKQPGSPQTQKKKHDTFKDGTVTPFESWSTPTQGVVDKSDYGAFCKAFQNYFRSDTTGIQTYLQKIDGSLGTYDLVAGKVTEYSFSIQEDGTYDVSLDISQGNQISLAIPHNTHPNPGKGKASEKGTPADIEYPTKDQITKYVISDFNLSEEGYKSAIEGVKFKVEDQWFNFLKINKQQKDTTASDTSYISLRFILKVLMNYSVSGKNVDKSFFGFELPTYMDGKNEIEACPVVTHKYIMSSSDMVIYPRKQLPKLNAPVKGKDGKPPKNNNVITIDEKAHVDGTINKIDFDIVGKTLTVPVTGAKIECDKSKNQIIGDALNIFIKYSEVVKHWHKSATRIDFLERILNTVNDSSYGFFRLVFGLQSENGKPTIIDYKYATPSIQAQNNAGKTYRFKPTTLDSIVKQFTFNFEMSNLVAGRTVFNSGKILAKIKTEGKFPAGDIPIPEEIYKSIDHSTFGNADGWYSINKIEIANLEKDLEKLKKEPEIEKEDPDKPKESATNEAEDMTQVLNNKSINFLMTQGAAKTILLIFQDKEWMKKQMFSKAEDAEDKSGLTPISISITIDGFSGFTCGQYFEIDGIPEIYNRLGVFQITNTKHNVSTDGWYTTIEADYRLIKKT